MSKQPRALELASHLEAMASRVPTLNDEDDEDLEAASLLRSQHQLIGELVEALSDMNAGWKYIRSFHGDLYGVGWDRAQGKADAALSKAKEHQ